MGIGLSDARLDGLSDRTNIDVPRGGIVFA